MTAFLAYLATIVLANVAITMIGFVPVGFGLMAPAGVFFAGLALGARDWLQESKGRRWTIAAIVLGAGLSAFLSPALAVASGTAFLASELADMGVWTPLRERGYVLTGVLASNSVGLVIDSMLFLWLAFGSLDFLAGQMVGKVEVTLLTVVVLWIWRVSRRRQVAFA
jgi:uncharacterized PurR-regulated membrane protein YhhQ (DUF165 family)